MRPDEIAQFRFDCLRAAIDSCGRDLPGEVVALAKEFAEFVLGGDGVLPTQNQPPAAQSGREEPIRA